MRAGYDFLLLRCASGEIDQEIGEWWTAFIAADGVERESLLNTRLRAESNTAPAKKRKRRRTRSKSEATGASTADKQGNE